ncbi:MAG TPA: DUF4870 domain-containing protein [Blastocatellia bacterium]|jgi:uncharacterized membrane protein|nr:DUF4870 domain-containing protein [Blastocatellia bacterium]
MSNQPPYGQSQGSGYQSPPPQGDKTKVLNLDHNVAAMLAYLPICCISVITSIIWIATEPKESRFLRFHALQSLFLTGALFAILFVLWILGFIAARIFFGFGLLVWLLEMAVCGIGLILFIVGAVKGYQRQMWKLPVIGDMAEKNC